MPEDFSIDIKQYNADEIRQLHRDTMKRHGRIIRRQRIAGWFFTTLLVSSLLAIPYGVLFVPWFSFWSGIMLTMFGMVSFGIMVVVAKATADYHDLSRPFMGYGLKPELQDADILRFRKEVLFRPSEMSK